MIKIRLKGKKGIDYNDYVDSYFSDFSMDGFPVFLGGKGQYDGKQLLLLDKLEPNPKNTKVLVLDGKDLFYYFTGHTVSGKLTKVTLATLGKSYNKKDGSFDVAKKGTIANISAVVEISGLAISNPKEVRGDLHNTIYGLMGGAHESGGTSDPTLLFSFVNGKGHDVKGTGKSDSYEGTAHRDKIDLGKGNDALNGAGGKDTLVGGKGKDTFVFDSALGTGNVDRLKDFNPGQDKIALSATVFALGAGKLASASFATGSAAKDVDDRIIYDGKSGALSFDADGSGPGSAMRFATLAKKLDLAADDFVVT